MYNKNKIRQLIEERNVLIKDFLFAMDQKGSSLAVFEREGANPTAKTLEAIADFFDISIDELFDREKTHHIIPGNGNDVASVKIDSLNKQIEGLKSIIAEKDARIQLLDDMVTLLRQQENTQQPL